MYIFKHTSFLPKYPEQTFNKDGFIQRHLKFRIFKKAQSEGKLNNIIMKTTYSFISQSSDKNEILFSKINKIRKLKRT